MHFQSLEKALAKPFPIAILTKVSFMALLKDIDTVPDLWYYLRDRFMFLKEIYQRCASLLLDLNHNIEPGILAFYRLHNNAFRAQCFESESVWQYQAQLQAMVGKAGELREAENGRSRIIDQMIDGLRENAPQCSERILHLWELASMSRRQRATVIADKLIDAFERLGQGNKTRHFAVFNEATECWLVFYFQCGGLVDGFYSETERLTKLKLFQVMKDSQFIFSVFGYGFYKSELWTNQQLDRVCLALEDASSHHVITSIEYSESLQFFGGNVFHKIEEYPQV